MGFNEWLGKLGRGMGNLAMVPIGLPWDLARSFTDRNFTTGDAFGNLWGRVGTGFSELGSAFYLDKGLEATGLGDGLMWTFKELNKLYDHEYQVHEGSAGLYGAFGREPGEVSLGRGLSAITGTVGSWMPGGAPATLDVAAEYRRNANKGPGRALFDSLLINPDMTEQEKELVRASPAYGFGSGLVDAASRWYFQPEIIVGKGIGKLRKRYQHQSTREWLAREFRKRSNGRVNVEAVDADIPVVRGTQSSGRVIVVMPRSQYRYLRQNHHDFNITPDMDAALANPERVRIMERINEEQAKLVPQVDTGVTTGTIETIDAATMTATLHKLDELFSATGPWRHMRDVWLKTINGDAGLSEIERLLNALDSVRTDVITPVERQSLLAFLADSVDDAIDAKMMSLDYGKLNRSVEKPVDNGVRVFFEDEWSTVAQYTDDLVARYPDNPPILLELDPDGMHFIMDDYYGPGKLDAWTSMEQITSANVKRVLRPNKYTDPYAFTGVTLETPPVIGKVSRTLSSMPKQDFIDTFGTNPHPYLTTARSRKPTVDVPDSFVGIKTFRGHEVGDIYDRGFEFIRNGESTVRLYVFTDSRGRVIDISLSSAPARVANKSAMDVLAVFAALRKQYPKLTAEHLAKRLISGREELVGLPSRKSYVASLRQAPPMSLSPESAAIVWNYLRREVRAADRIMASRVKDPILYNVDGTPIRPDSLINLERLTDDQLTVMRLMAQDDGPVLVSRFLKGKELARRTDTRVNGVQGRLARNKSVQVVINWTEGKSESQIRDRLFRNNVHGDELASMFVQAKTYEEKLAIISAGMRVASPELFTMEPMLRTRLERIINDTGSKVMATERYIHSEAIEMGMIAPERLQTAVDIKALQEMAVKEIAAMEAEIAFRGGLAKMFEHGAIDYLPRLTLGGAARQMAIYSSWYQSPLGRPIRSVIEKRAHHHVNLHDPFSDQQLVRQLQEARSLGITQRDIDTYRNRYIRAQTEQEKLQVMVAAENRIITLVGRKSGLTKQQIQDLIAHSRHGRQTTMDILNSRKYGPGDTDMVKWVDPDTGEVMIVRLPLLSTQLANWVPLADVRRLIQISSRFRRVIGKGTQYPKEILDSFYHVWKPTVLLRTGWPLRVVTDEQFRILARTHSLIKHLASIEAGGQPRVPGVLSKGNVGQRVARGFAKPATILTKTGVAGASLQTRVARKLGLLDEDWYRYVQEAGVEPLASSRAAFGGPSESVLRQYQAILGSHEAGILDHLRTRATGQWMSINQGDPMYRHAWYRALKEQIGRDDLGRYILTDMVDGLGRGMTLEQAVLRAKDRAVRWLDESIDGKEYAKRMSQWKDHEDWVENVLVMIHDYTGQFNVGLMEGTLAGKVSREMLDRVDVALRPATVHHEIIAQTLGSSGIIKFMQDTFAEAFDLLGRLPTDTLSRQPLFRHIYANEMKSRYDMMVAQGVEVTERMYQRMSHTSRQIALREVKTYLYDLAETSRFGNLMRWFMPFYPAWQEVIGVWSKLVVADPSIMGRALLLWNAPNKAGLITTDDDGNQFITLRMSEALADKIGLPESGWARYVATGGIRFGKTSFNLVLNSPLPGSGPVIQVPVNEAVKQKPELEESLRWILPFGVNPNSLNVAMSPIVNRIQSQLTGHSSDRQYISAFGNAISWLDFQYRAGHRTDPPTYLEAKNIADKIFLMRVIGNISFPAQPIFDSPLKPYFDVWSDLQASYGADMAEEMFLNEYGPEFFAVTLGRTVSQTGIPPTVEAQVARRPLEHLIQEYPEYGRLIIGEDASVGEFSSAAYAWQLTHNISEPGQINSEMEREYRNFLLDPDTGRLEAVDVSLGWIAYLKFLDLLEVERKNRGLPSLKVKEAEDLAELKRRYTEDLAAQYPAWERSMNQRNDLKWRDRIRAFRSLSRSDLLQERPDWDGIRDYLNARDIILSELNRRKQIGGSGTLSATSNSDIAELWEALVTEILDDNIYFVPVYYRYLEGDSLEIGSNG